MQDPIDNSTVYRRVILGKYSNKKKNFEVLPAAEEFNIALKVLSLSFKLYNNNTLLFPPLNVYNDKKWKENSHNST